MIHNRLMPITRREFIGVGAAAALALRPSSGQALRQGSAQRMFVSLNGALLQGKNVPWPDSARLAARLGFGGIDWSLGPAKTAGVDATRALFAELKIKPTITGLPVTAGRGDDAAFQGALGPLAEDAKFCAAIGCTKMMVVLSPASPAPKSEYLPMFLARMKAVAGVLQRSNISLGLEFLGVQQFRTRPDTHEFIWRMNDAVAFAKECGPNVGVVLDVWHWHHAGATVKDILDAGRSRIIHVHVSDARRQAPEDVRDNQRLMPGEGIIDLTGFFKALQTIGYDEGISPEPLGRVTPEMTAEEAAKLGLDTTLAAMKRAGMS
jgi:sugar phosphate isomerase/epimerase